MMSGLALSGYYARGIERWKTDVTNAIRLHNESIRKDQAMPTILGCDGLDPSQTEQGFTVNEVACEDGFTLARARYRCEVCGKTKPKHHAFFPGLRLLDVCDKCAEAQAAPLWYAVAQVVLAGDVENMTERGIEMVMTTMAYHGVTTEEFNDMVSDDIRVLETADELNKKAGIIA